MAPARRTVRHPDSAVLAAGVAARLSVTILDTLAERPTAHLLISGGPLILESLSALAAQPLLRAVDFSRLHVWWSDDLLVPAGDPRRNETAAHAVLRPVIVLPPTHLHPLPAAPLPAEQAVEHYAGELRFYAEPPGGDAPLFDVAILELTSTGQIAGLRPDRPESQVTDRTVVLVDDPLGDGPPRITVTLPVLRNAERVWMVATGSESVEAVRSAWHAFPHMAQSPASLVGGRQETLLLVDNAAAAGLQR